MQHRSSSVKLGKKKVRRLSTAPVPFVLVAGKVCLDGCDLADLISDDEGLAIKKAFNILWISIMRPLVA